MKLLIFLHNSFDKLAGTERVLYNLIEFFSKSENFKIILLLTSVEKPIAIDVRKFGVDIQYLSIGSDTGKNSFVLLNNYYTAYKKLVCKFNMFNALNPSSVTIISTNPFLSLVGYKASSRCFSKIPVNSIACEHFSISVSGKVSRLVRKYIYKQLYVVTLTNKDKDFIQEKYKPKDCECIPNAVPFHLNNYNFNPNCKTVLAIGRLTYQKGYDMLIESYSLIAAKYPDWKLIIVGDDYGDKNLLDNKITKYGLKNNIFIYPATKNIQNYYKEASFFVMSSRYEGLPMVLLEAMSFGLPLISFDCPTGPAEIISDENGYLVENGNIEEFAIRMELLMSNSELLINKSKGSQCVVKNFSKDRINALWKQFFYNNFNITI